MERPAAWLTRVCVNHCLSRRRDLRLRGWPPLGLVGYARSPGDRVLACRSAGRRSGGTRRLRSGAGGDHSQLPARLLGRRVRRLHGLPARNRANPPRTRSRHTSKGARGRLTSNLVSIRNCAPSLSTSRHRTLHPALLNIDVAMPDRRRRSVFNLFAGIAAAALVAASVTVFGIALRTHGNPAPGPAVRSASPSPSPLRAMPLLGEGGVPTAAQVVVPTLRGHGSRQLEMFVPQGTLWHPVRLCRSRGLPVSRPPTALSATTSSSARRCLGVTTLTVDGPKAYDDKPMTSSRRRCTQG